MSLDKISEETQAACGVAYDYMCRGDRITRATWVEQACTDAFFDDGLVWIWVQWYLFDDSNTGDTT